MATYSGIADASGDFTIPFSTNYTSGQKVIVTAEKDAATKSIELYAPSELKTANGIIFGGSLNDFPNNIDAIGLFGITGRISDYAFNADSTNSLWREAKSLIINDDTSIIGDFVFSSWIKATSLIIGNSVTSIGVAAFSGWVSAINVTVGSSVISIDSIAFTDLTACNTINILALNPPKIAADTFAYRKSSCIFKVPAASLAAYKAAPIWKTFATKIFAIA